MDKLYFLRLLAILTLSLLALGCETGSTFDMWFSAGHSKFYECANDVFYNKESSAYLVEYTANRYTIPRQRMIYLIPENSELLINPKEFPGNMRVGEYIDARTSGNLGLIPILKKYRIMNGQKLSKKYFDRINTFPKGGMANVYFFQQIDQYSAKTSNEILEILNKNTPYQSADSSQMEFSKISHIDGIRLLFIPVTIPKTKQERRNDYIFATLYTPVALVSDVFKFGVVWPVTLVTWTITGTKPFWVETWW